MEVDTIYWKGFRLLKATRIIGVPTTSDYKPCISFKKNELQ